MAANPKPPVYRIYLLTVWQVQEPAETTEASWRFHLTDPQTGKRAGFTSPATLLAALQKLRGEDPPRLMFYDPGFLLPAVSKNQLLSLPLLLGKCTLFVEFFQVNIKILLFIFYAEQEEHMQRKEVHAKWLPWLMLVSLLLGLALVPAAPLTAATNPGAIEPQAGQWQTWVLKSGSELRPDAPPDQAATQKELAELEALAGQRDANALDQIAYWDAGAPNYRWIEITFTEMQKKPLSNPRFNRLLALLNVAIYDAMIAAWDAKYTYNRARPSANDVKLTPAVAVPHSPSYPSEQAVAAGAASAILAYIYPDDAKLFAAKAEEAGRSRLLAGVNYPSDVTAGLALGRAVAAKVIARAKTDGADAKWTGRVPTEKGKWTGTNPVEPLMGTWQTWVLKTGNQVRPAAPPAYDSVQKQAELKELQTYTRTWQTNQKALFWQTFDGIYTFYYDTASKRIFEHHLDTNPPAAARIYALLSVTQYDTQVACWDAKYAYWAMRPFMYDKSFVTLFPTPNHPSYPAAHGCYSGATAAILSALFPADAPSITAKAEEAALSRLWAGIHFRSDIETGLQLGRKVAQMVIEHAKQDGSQPVH